MYSTEQAVPRPRRYREEKSLERDLHLGVRAAQQKVIVRLERKGRGGKCVTVVKGFPMPQRDREALLKRLKTKLGTGGVVRDSGFEIQGDHCDALMAALKEMGCVPRRSGG